MLSSFDKASRCEFWQHRCLPYRIQMASGLLPSATVRASDPDRGPWPLGLQVTVGGLAALVALVGVLVIRRRRTRVA